MADWEGTRTGGIAAGVAAAPLAIPLLGVGGLRPARPTATKAVRCFRLQASFSRERGLQVLLG